MTFAEFIATRREVADLRTIDVIGDYFEHSPVPVPGLLYSFGPHAEDALFIERIPQGYRLEIVRDGWEVPAEHLPELEWRLFDYVRDECGVE